MSKRTLLLAALGAFALVCALPAVPVQADHHEEAKLVGCLTAGEDGSMTLTPEEGEAVHVSGGDDVKAHAENHKVELTGKWVEMDGHKTFEASAVEHLGVCE